MVLYCVCMCVCVCVCMCVCMYVCVCVCVCVPMHMPVRLSVFSSKDSLVWLPSVQGYSTCSSSTPQNFGKALNWLRITLLCNLGNSSCPMYM